jgi:predicted transcriptional regulator
MRRPEPRTVARALASGANTPQAVASRASCDAGAAIAVLRSLAERGLAMSESEGDVWQLTEKGHAARVGRP